MSNTSTQPHIAIIGSGSAAFAAALKANDNGASVTLIEGQATIGGCCVNVGCVPSKMFIQAAQLAEQQRRNPWEALPDQEPTLGWQRLIEQQQARVEDLRAAKYENILAQHSDIYLLQGYARFVNKHTLHVTTPTGATQTVSADKILIATGSTPTIPAISGLAATPYWTSTEALFATQQPKHLLVIGASVVALELAQAYRRLGSDVTVLARRTLLAREDPLLGEALAQRFAAEGIQVLNHISITHVAHAEEQFTLSTTAGTLTGDQLLVSTGCHANTTALNLQAAGVTTDAAGKILVNAHMETNVAGIYAAGDCADLPQHVYVAAAAGSRAGVNMTGGDVRLDLRVMPAVIFTDPQVATVGLSEVQAQQQGFNTDSRVLSLADVPRALVNFDTDGYVKLVMDKATRRLLGAQILAHEGGEVVQSAALAIHNHMTVDDIAEQLFPYLTMVEALKLCAQTFNQDIKSLSCCAG